MILPRLGVLAAFAVGACSGSSASANVLGRDRPLVGTWRATEYANPRAQDSTRVYPFGRPPRGYLVYDRTGHVFFQVAPDLPVERGRWREADSASLNRLLSGAAAYFGTYTADYVRGTVVHRIEGEIPPNPGITEVAAPFRVTGDTLILGHDSTSHWRFLRVR